MIDKLRETNLPLAPVEDQHPVEAFASDRADEPLGEGVRPRRSDRRAGDPDILEPEHLVEAGREPGVSVPKQEAWLRRVENRRPTYTADRFRTDSKGGFNR